MRKKTKKYPPQEVEKLMTEHALNAFYALNQVAALYREFSNEQPGELSDIKTRQEINIKLLEKTREIEQLLHVIHMDLVRVAEGRGSKS